MNPKLSILHLDIGALWFELSTEEEIKFLDLLLKRVALREEAKG